MNVGIGLSVSNFSSVPTVGLDLDAAIAALFSSGEEGAWYDPSDLTTLYQDAAGTTPVTGTGQPVGLMLDKSKGLTLGSEVVTNGTFDTDSNWDKGTHWTISGGVASSVNGSLRNLSQVCLTVGKTYKVSWDQTTSSGNIVVFVGLGTQTPAITGTGTKTAICKATTNTTLYFQAQNGFTGTIDNISVKELPGNHATQSTSTARPTLQVSGGLYYLDFDGVDDWMGPITLASSQPQPFTIASGWKFDSIATSGYSTVHDGIDTTHRAFLADGASENQYRLTAGSGLGFSVARDALDHVTLIKYHGATSYGRIDGVLDVSGNAGSHDLDGYHLGRAIPGSGIPLYPMNGHIYGFVGVNRTLTTAEIEATESYLATKSGVTLP
jgi:hypothetical protein